MKQYIVKHSHIRRNHIDPKTKNLTEHVFAQDEILDTDLIRSVGLDDDLEHLVNVGALEEYNPPSVRTAPKNKGGRPRKDANHDPDDEEDDKSEDTDDDEDEDEEDK
jgi:hypothetical protein